MGSNVYVVGIYGGQQCICGGCRYMGGMSGHNVYDLLEQYTGGMDGCRGVKGN